MAGNVLSKKNYADIYAADRGGINVGLDADIYLNQEATPRVYNPPSVGTAGQSIGDTSPSTDISAGTDDNLDIAVDGGAVVTANIASVAGLNTGSLIAAALETAINAALSAASQSAKVCVAYVTDHYEVLSQNVGAASSVVITDAGADNLADDLLLGVANSGVESVGLDDTDCLLYTEGGFTYEQPFEPSPHRSGRFFSGIVKQKCVAAFDVTTLFNMKESGADVIDPAIQLLWKSLVGGQTNVAGSPNKICYNQKLPTIFISAAVVSTIYGEYYTGAYVQGMTITQPGDAVGTMQWTGIASEAYISGLSQVDGAVSASANVVVNLSAVDGQSEACRYSANGRVMVVKADGETITDGFLGDLYVVSVNAITNTVVLNRPVDAEDNGYLVPWNPGANKTKCTDNIYSDLTGEFKLDCNASESQCITNFTASFANNHFDINNCFGAKCNQGFIPAERLTVELSVTFDLSNENFAQVVKLRDCKGLCPYFQLGDPATTGAYFTLQAENWIPNVPPIALPSSGPTPITLTGTLYETSKGSNDPFKATYYEGP